MQKGVSFTSVLKGQSQEQLTKLFRQDLNLPLLHRVFFLQEDRSGSFICEELEQEIES